METKVFTQYGYPVIIGSAVALIGMVIALVMEDTLPSEGFVSVIVVIGTLAFAILMSFKMTICVDDQYVWFRMGIGFVGKTYELSDILECQIVKIHSSGVRRFRNGRLYSISGFRAVELKFHSTHKVVRLGTNRPEELCEAINNAISKPKRKKEFYY
jgi:hypothetical protein